MNKLEINCYNIWFEYMKKKLYKKPDALIYLKCSPTKCQSRICKRSRNEESLISFEYLEELDKYHEDWINNYKEVPVLIINNDIDDNYDCVIEKINDFIKKLK